MPQIHEPDIYGPVRLATAQGTAGQVLTSAGAGNQAVWGAGAGAITAAGCPVQIGLTAGGAYLWTGLTQGTLGSYDMLTVALDATHLSNLVHILPVGAAAGTSYTGFFDYNSCLLIRVWDQVGNDISGSANITVFPWFNSAVQNNYVDFESTLTLTAGWPAPGESFTSNTIRDSQLTINDAGDEIIFDNNTLEGSQLTLDTPGTVLAITIRSNSAHIAFIDMDPTGPLSFQGNQLGANVSLTIAQAYELNFSNNVADNETVITIAGTGTSVMTILRGQFLKQSQISIIPFPLSRLFQMLKVEVSASSFSVSGNIQTGPDASFQNVTLLDQSALTITACPNGEDLTGNLLHAIGGSSFLFNALGGLVVAAAIENQANLITAGFNLIGGRLNGANSTLIANTTDATKTGYTNALP